MIFNTLLELARTGDFTMAVKVVGAERDRLTLLLVPQPKEGTEPALAQPLQMTGTVDELEAGFAEAVGQVTQARSTLLEQVAATLTIMEEAKKAQADKASSTLKAPGKRGPTKLAPATTGQPRVVDDDGEDNDGHADSDLTGAASTPAESPAPASAPPAAAPQGGLNLFG